ncbi:MAG TPA: ATP phosphoribosyltransferase regulatory subunit [Paenalcaligenes sp.]|nr:ATP phosphoribosyltransferase regulatory subunit [Paenalcaligenes sp.]
MSNWLLPEHLADVLPAEARHQEELRRSLLDLYRSYGFELVAPPLAEYLESLQAISGSPLNLRTNKLIDQLSGRTMGVRADMTPQVARIDAHLLNRPGVTRLCYCGSVLHARPESLLAQRERLQIGAEIYGYAGVEADIEIIRLALASVARAGVENSRLDLNLPAVGYALLKQDPILHRHAQYVLDLLSAKDNPGLLALTETFPGADAGVVQQLLSLTELYGQALPTLEKARQQLPQLPEIVHAFEQLQELIVAFSAHHLTLDLADMGSSYGYHTGVVFCVYAHGWHNAIVRGGRYDGIGKLYGRDRPATGFSLDLRVLAATAGAATQIQAIRAPWGTDPQLLAVIDELRNQGEVVLQCLPDEVPSSDEFVIQHQIVKAGDQWVVKPVSTASPTDS